MRIYVQYGGEIAKCRWFSVVIAAFSNWQPAAACDLCWAVFSESHRILRCAIDCLVIYRILSPLTYSFILFSFSLCKGLHDSLSCTSHTCLVSYSVFVSCREVIVVGPYVVSSWVFYLSMSSCIGIFLCAWSDSVCLLVFTSVLFSHYCIISA